MANPQKDNGYTPISHEIIEALARTRIPGEARQMLDVILRKTYGWGKKHDQISTSQFIKATGLSRLSIYKARKKLLGMNLITISKKGDSQILIYSLQKDYEKWILSPKKELSPKKVTAISKKGKQGISQLEPTIDTITIDNIQKKAVPAEDFIQSLKTNTAYSHINIDQELGKMDAWLLAHPGRQKTKRFIVNWLNKIDKPLPIINASSQKGSTPSNLSSEVDKLLKEKLSKIVTKDMIKAVLRQVPEDLWYKVSAFLGKQHPGKGNDFIEAKKEIGQEIKKNRVKFNELVKGVVNNK